MRNLSVSGKSTSDYHHRQQQLRESSSKETCHLCKESKRRKLAAYIRGKTRVNSCSEIHEEVEEEAEEEEEDECDAGIKKDDGRHPVCAGKKTQPEADRPKMPKV